MDRSYYHRRSLFHEAQIDAVVIRAFKDKTAELKIIGCWRPKVNIRTVSPCY